MVPEPRRRKEPTLEEGTFLTFPDIYKLEPIEIEDFMNIPVAITQNNGHEQKTHGTLKLRDIMRKMW